MKRGAYNSFEYIIVGILVSVTVMAGAFLSSSRVSADEMTVTKNASVTVPDACTMTGSGMDSHTAEVANGTYVSEIGSTTLKITCNDGGGFSVYAIGFTGDAYEGEDHTKLIGVNSGQKIVTGTATGAGSSDISNWAMKVGTDSGATYPLTLDNSFGSYHAVPDTYTKVAYRTSGTDIGLSATGSELTTTYAAYVSRTQSADTYDGKVKYTLVHPATEVPLQPVACPGGYICYNANGGNVVGTMGQQSVGTSTTSMILLASNFSRDGYGFAGWNDKFDYSGKFYGPNEYIKFTAGQYSSPNNGLSLYAVWVESVGDFQDSSIVASVCSGLVVAPVDGSANLSSISALTDQRDSETYAIARLADGNCWMIENLRLEAEDTRGDTKKALAQGYGTSDIYGNFSGLADAESENFTNSTTANSLYSTDGSNGTINIGTSSYPGYRMPRYNNLNTPVDASNRPQNPTSNEYTQDRTTVGMYSYGNYYTWSAAIANTIFYDSKNATDVDGKTSDNVDTSLCPTGWRLPYGDNTGNGATTGSFSYLDIRLGGTGAYQGSIKAADRWRAFPNNIIYSGAYITSSNYSLGAYGRGYYGSYLTSTAYNSSNYYGFYLAGNTTYPGTNREFKSDGYSIRCLAFGS